MDVRRRDRIAIWALAALCLLLGALLALTNLGGVAMTVIDLHVTISHVTAPNATPSRPCSVTDFAAAQVASGFALDLGPAESTSFSARSIPSSQWPQISMLNTAANQD